MDSGKADTSVLTAINITFIEDALKNLVELEEAVSKTREEIAQLDKKDAKNKALIDKFNKTLEKQKAININFEKP